MNRLINRLFFGFFILAALAGCESNPSVATQRSAPQSEIQFASAQAHAAEPVLVKRAS